MIGSIDSFSIKGFKSIENISEFKLNDLNVIVGANGVGKSNFIQVFDLLNALAFGNLDRYVKQKGGADNFLYNGPKVTDKIDIKLNFELNHECVNSYHLQLIPTVDDSFIFSDQRVYGTLKYEIRNVKEINTSEEQDKEVFVGEKEPLYNRKAGIYGLISQWIVYHFHDTSETASMRRAVLVDDNMRLRSDGSNIAPFLLKLRREYPECYKLIVESIRLVMPYFDDFILTVLEMGPMQKVKLDWRQKGSDFPMQPYHLSDGSIRFICLATALLQPELPPTLIIDEPELGLYPRAISILAELIENASKRTQVIVSTQSPLLVDNFSVEDIIVMNRKDGSSTMERLSSKELSVWLEQYSLGELFTKNLLQGYHNE